MSYELSEIRRMLNTNAFATKKKALLKVLASAKKEGGPAIFGLYLGMRNLEKKPTQTSIREGNK